jgi:hypothetical protein
MLEKLLKLLIGNDVGGRYFLTIVAGGCFAYMVITKSIDGKEAMAVIVMVFTLYFTRSDRSKPENTQTGGQK